tara:strand:- start:336 stop:506 length:171 start_codon:yes stop_codon:yes gene_type:complete
MKKNLNPFDKIDPLLNKKEKKENQFIKKFMEFIENKNKQELLEIQKFIHQKLNEFQ